MNNHLGKFEIEEKEIDLDTVSIEILKDNLKKIKEMEQKKKQELNDVLGMLNKC